MTREEFNVLIDKYLAGNATPAEEKIINDFVGKQEKRTVVHYRLSDDMWKAIADKVQYEQHVRVLQENKPSNRSFFFKIAASVALVLTVGALTYYTYSQLTVKETSWSVSKAPFGQKSIVTLGDGTRVHLNSGSSLQYPQEFAEDKREIVLTGEAFFEVTRDVKRPFLVKTGNITTRVLGTSFNIHAFADENVTVTVATGKVQVEAQVPNAGDNDITEYKRVVLTPNQQVIYDKSNETLEAHEVDVTAHLAWTDNTLHFEDASLEEVVQLLNRWYNVEIKLESDAIRSCRVNGKYKEQSLTSVLKSIQYMYQIDYSFITKDSVTLSGKGCGTN